MCAFTAIGGGTAGTVTVTMNQNTQNMAIQVIELSGDSSATFATNGVATGGSNKSTSAPVSLTATSGDFELFLGDAENGSTAPSWTAPSGFTLVNTQTPSPLSGANAWSAPVYLGPATSTVTATLSPTSFWGTIGIEIKP